MKTRFNHDQRICEKVNGVITWGVVHSMSKRSDNVIIYYVRWDDGYGGYREEQDLIPLGEPDNCLKEIL